MVRIPSLALAALALLAVPLAALAERDGSPEVAETVVLAAFDDALPAAAPARSADAPVERTAASERTHRSAPQGSSQSAAAFRFSNPYAFPEQTLPLNFPTLPTFGF
jgi:hypothetical protein